METESREVEFRFGQGKISGALSLTLGAMAFGAVLCLLFPSLLTTPEARGLYPMGLVRAAIQVTLIAAFVLGVISVMLSRRRQPAMAGMALALAATLLGGSEVQVDTVAPRPVYLGLDWFILDLLLFALICVPMERLFARLKEQRIFRKGWKTDLVYFGVSHLFVQVSVLLTLMPAALFFRWAVQPGLQAAVASQPLALQFLEIVIVADLFTYGSHRLFHTVPFLWRFHQIHHSTEQLDWLAGSRLHIVDIVLTRAVSFVPLYVMGFANAAVYAYLVFVSFHAVFIHANVRFRFGPLRWLVVTPQYHHWHHGAQQKAINKNFAIHLPALDLLFGTCLLPEDEWPRVYGISGNPVPEGFLKQFILPFARSRPADSVKPSS